MRQFLSYVIAAVQTVSGSTCRESAAILNAPEMPPASALAGCLGNDLEAIETPFVLVIDDYHRVHEQAIHSVLSQLLQHPPRSLHLVLITRRDPPLPLAGLRARSSVVEIREEDLRFSREETRTVLQKMVGISVTDETLSHLHGEIEGWIVGLRLAGLALRNQADPEGYLAQLHGGTQSIQQYLLEEVLKHEAPDFQQWLLRTSILNRFCAPLCEAVCSLRAEDRPAADEDVVRGETFLQDLERANLFAIRLDDRGEWMRYHHLFQRLLQWQLQRQVKAEEIARLHNRASAWFENEDLLEEALEHAVRAGNVERATQLVEKNRVGLLNDDKWYVLEKWLRLLPDAIRRERPGLLLAEAWSAYERFQFDRLAAILENVGSLLEGDHPDPTVSGETLLLRGELHYWAGESEASLQLFEEARAQLPEQHGLVRGLLELQYGLALCMGGEKDRAIKGLNELVQETGPPEGIYLSRLVAGLFFIHLLSGNLFLARTEAERLRTVAKRSDITYTDAWSSYMEACSHFHANEPEKALTHFAEAARQRYILHARAAVDALAGLALTQQFMQQVDAAAESLDLLQTFSLELSDSQYLSVAHSCRARVALLRGDLTSALEWARSVDEVTVPAALFMWMEVPRITQARVLIADGTPTSVDRAIELLQHVRRQSEACRFVNQTIEVAVLQCLALARQGRRKEALEQLADAVGLAEPGGWVRPFVEAGPPMAQLLAQLPKGDQGRRFVEQLRRSLEDKAGASARLQEVRQPLIEPLTNRELDVLEHLAKRMYDKEIAEALSISIGTVKTHLKHIYEKLDVPNRRHAVIKAEELGLLQK